MTDSLAPSLILASVIEVESEIKTGQVRVSRLDLPEGNETDWLRVMTPFASDGAGALFSPDPEKGDLAVLAFHGRKPVVLGFLYGGKAAMPTKKPEEKIIKTKDGSSLTLIDGEDAGIVLADKHENRIAMTKDGITLTSKGDIKIEASGTATIIGKTVELNP